MNVVVVLALLFVLTEVSGKVSYKGDQVLRVNPRNDNDRDILQQLGDVYKLRFWREPQRQIGPVDVQVSKDKLLAIKLLLKLKNINFEIMIDDVEEAILAQTSPRKVQLNLQDFDYNKYHTFEEINQWTSDFAKAHSNYVKRLVVGKTYENRTFHALKISSGGSSKPAFALDCGIHADEWIGPATCLHVVKYLTDSIGTSSKVGEIMKDVDFYIIPSSNPDGYAYTWATNRLWRKTRSPSSEKCFGVDPNRNWDEHWSGNGSSTDPCSDTYRGPHAWSEANVRAQRDFVNSVPNIQGYIDIHSYSQLWMFPYSYTFNLPRNYALMSKIANQSVEAIKMVHNQTYTPGTIARTIYVASGSTADYFFDHLKLKCVFAAELRDTGKHGMLLPESEIQPTAEEAFAGLMVIASYIKDGQCTS